MQFKSSQPKRLTQNRLIMLALVIIAVVMGFVSSFSDGTLEWRGLGSNLATELIGAVITYFIIEGIVKTNADNSELKKRLIRRLENPDTGITWDTLQELRAKGWLQDGSLYGWFLQRANLEGAYLRDVQTNGLGLYRCNLKGAKIDEEQFFVMNDLRRTLMPDGEMYDGRYCLIGDLSWAQTHYGIDVNLAAPQQMADYYEVAVERYLAGQQWARVNLPDPPDYLKNMQFEP